MRNTKGITLIALVITIIVLLILAGVSLIAGENGILGRATRAVDRYNEETAKEEKELKKADDLIGKYMGEVNEKSLTKQVKAEHYGERVNYSITVNGVVLDDWKIFYNDGNEVTMIYGGYLPNSTNLAQEAGFDTTGDYIVFQKSTALNNTAVEYNR